MRLWTIQTIEAWNALQRTGVLHADPSLIEDYRLPAYNWLATRMHERIGKPPTDCSYPIWAWYQWQGHNKRRPDLRSTAHLPKGSHGIRIEIEVDEKNVLLSDFELWHYVLNYWYLPISERAGESFKTELAKAGLCFHRTTPLPDLNYHKQIEESWSRIFDLDWSADAISSRREDKTIQGVFWELNIEQVQNVKEFIAR